jgi:DNA repair protein RadC
MSNRNSPLLSDKDGIPYGEIYGRLARQTRERRAAAREDQPLRWDWKPLVNMFKRLGTVPPHYTPRRAALRVLLAATEMAREHKASIEEVYATLAAHCDPDAEGAVCVEPPRCVECSARSKCAYALRRPSIKQLPKSERPRERLLTVGAENLTDAEILAILIGGGSKEDSALGLAQRLLATFGSLRKLDEAGNRELQSVKGIGKAKAAQIRAGLELGRRLGAEPLNTGIAIKNSEQTFRHYHARMKDLKKETFLCLMLDTKHTVICEEEIAVGSLNETIVHPREVFKRAIAESAAAVFFIHNHPSGNPEPSPQDKKLTERLCDVGKIVGIRVLDHLIIGRETYYSFAAQGEINS